MRSYICIINTYVDTQLALWEEIHAHPYEWHTLQNPYKI